METSSLSMKNTSIITIMNYHEARWKMDGKGEISSNKENSPEFNLPFYTKIDMTGRKGNYSVSKSNFYTEDTNTGVTHMILVA